MSFASLRQRLKDFEKEREASTVSLCRDELASLSFEIHATSARGFVENQGERSNDVVIDDTSSFHSNFSFHATSTNLHLHPGGSRPWKFILFVVVTVYYHWKSDDSLDTSRDNEGWNSKSFLASIIFFIPRGCNISEGEIRA